MDFENKASISFKPLCPGRVCGQALCKWLLIFHSFPEDLEHKTIISIAGVCVATCVRSKVKILIRGWKLLQQKLVLKYSKRTVSLRHVTIEAICPFVDQKIKFLKTPFNQNWRIKPAIFRSSSRFTLASTSVLPTVTYSHVDSFFSFYEKL